MKANLKNLIASLTLALCAIFGAQAGEWIRINQLGYLPRATKVAVMLCSDSVPVSSFDVVDAFTGKVVMSSASVHPMGPLGSMRATYRLNFSDLNAQGTYYLRVGQCKSPMFPVNGQVYKGTADFTLNYMRQQRCGWNPFLRDSCHQLDARIVYHPTKQGQHIDVRGGWHDAADLLQYTSTSANAIYQMLFAYQQNPSAFADNYQANGLPGSNGIPD